MKLASSSWVVIVRRVGVRAALLFLVLVWFPFPLDLLPHSDAAVEAIYGAESRAAAWLTRIVLGIAVDGGAPMTGSGDRPVDWALLFAQLAIATAGGAAWAAVVRHDRHHPRLLAIARTYLRFAAASTMLTYGAAKVFYQQFPPITEATLSQRFGDASPMHLVWTFMSYSEPYNWFTGGAECLAGVLLLSRRTATLGALVMLAVMTNVLMLNLCYDVPVKMFASQLVIYAIVLVGRDWLRLAALLVLHRPVPAPPPPPVRSRRWRRGLAAAQAVAMLWVGYKLVDGEREVLAAMRQPIAAAPFDASFRVTRHRRAGVEVTGDDRVIGWAAAYGSLVAERQDGARVRYRAAVDALAHTVTLTRYGDGPPTTATLQYTITADGLTLRGPLDGAEVELALVRRPPWLLMTRGFRWVNPVPYNR